MSPVDVAARDLAAEITGAVRRLRAARDGLERARRIAATYRWVAMALACAAARDQLDALADALDREGVGP